MAAESSQPMPSAEDEFLVAIELHSVPRLRAVLDRGLDVSAPMRGKSAVSWLTEMYTRSDQFPACLRLLLERGAALPDPVLAPVLLDDAGALVAALRSSPTLAAHRTTMASAFTPLEGATLLHVAAEYGHLQAARVLIEAGADVNAAAAIDVHGLGGQTPLFHTVNSNGNRSAPLLRLLLEAGARADVRVAGLTWGKGFAWESTFFDLTPIAYAQLGLLPQMHRDERHITESVRLLLEANGRPAPPLENIPNRYLTPTRNAS